MRIKRIAAVLLVLMMVFSIVGCAGQQTPPPAAQPTPPAQSEAEPPAVDEDDEEVIELRQYPPERYGELEFSDENVSIFLYFDRPQYTHYNVVNLRVHITNIGGETIVFTKGSGSNLVPDALRVELEPLTAMFIPMIATMDMQHMVLEPGESEVFDLPFAPYMLADPDMFPFVGPDADLSFFQNEDWVRVPAGEIQGSLSFVYVVHQGQDYFMVFEGDDISTVVGSFSVHLIEG